MPGVAANGACVYERALTWALEAEKLDLPHLSAQCERFIAMHWKHLHKYALRIENLSSPARHRIMMGMFHALEWATPDYRCSSCNGKGYKTPNLPSTFCMSCSGTGQRITHIKYPTVEDFMSWRTTPGGAS